MKYRIAIWLCAKLVPEMTLVNRRQYDGLVKIFRRAAIFVSASNHHHPDTGDAFAALEQLVMVEKPR